LSVFIFNSQVQLLCLSALVLLVGFIAGFNIGVRDKSKYSTEQAILKAPHPVPSHNIEQQHPSQFSDEYSDAPISLGSGNQGDSQNSSPTNPSSSFYSHDSSNNEPSLSNLLSEISADNIRQTLR